MAWIRGVATSLGVRFALCFTVSFGLGLVEEVANLGSFPDPQKDAIVQWTAAHIYHITGVVDWMPTGSGDRLWDWIWLADRLGASAVVAIAWLLADRKRAHEPELALALRFLARVSLSGYLISYGLVKVIPAQFGDVLLVNLAEPFGAFKPMDVLWKFMAYSPGYTMMAGWVEFSAGLLLLIPRLATLGALVATIAMSNVFALNMFYDIPVKNFSFQLLAFAVLLVAPEIRGLLDVLVFRRPTQPRSASPFASSRTARIAVVASWLALGAYGWHSLSDTLDNVKERKALTNTAAPLFGVWVVDTFVPDGRDAHLADRDERWERLVVQNDVLAFVETAVGPVRRTLDVDKSKHVMTLASSGVAKPFAARLAYREPKPGELELTGVAQGLPLELKLHRLDPSRYGLNGPRFHWIAPYPRFQ